MRTADFDYPLPAHLIAQRPVEPRDHARLLVLDRATGRLEHRRFYELGDYLQPGDLLVFNDTRVLPARLRGRRADTGGGVELLLLRRVGPGLWECLGRPGRRLREGVNLVLEGKGTALTARVVAVEEGGIRRVAFEDEARLEQVGEVPLPPYIREPLEDPERYQTVYARVAGSVAAPTAGLHFTPHLLESLARQGVRMAFLTLHIGLDTFRPVTEEDPRQHRLHTEFLQVPEETARAVEEARRAGRRVVAVGTTVVRALEQCALWSEAQGREGLGPCSGWADLFILPGHRFRAVDALITNFHLPRSTLLMLVCAFAGRERVLDAYREAVAQGYRFYSFGDAMLIL